MKYLKIAVILCLSITSFAQKRPVNEEEKSKELPYQQNQVRIRPTIMVFPFFKENENIQKIIEEDENKRIVLTKVKEIFDSRGYSTLDFISKARNLVTNQLLTNDTQTDLKTQILQASGADISVEVEYQYSQTQTGNEVKVILNAYESSSSASLANKVGFSGKFYSTDIGKLSSKAISTVSEEFINTIQQKFDDIVENGRYLSIEFGLADHATINMSTEIGPDQIPLSDVIESWAEQNSKSYHIAGVTTKKILFDVIRVPRLDATGKILTTSKYAFGLMNYLKTLRLSDKPQVAIKSSRMVKGNTIYVTLN